jgi:hypothetical protein
MSDTRFLPTKQIATDDSTTSQTTNTTSTKAPTITGFVKQPVIKYSQDGSGNITLKKII